MRGAAENASLRLRRMVRPLAVPTANKLVWLELSGAQAKV